MARMAITTAARRRSGADTRRSTPRPAISVAYQPDGRLEVSAEDIRRTLFDQCALCQQANPGNICCSRGRVSSFIRTMLAMGSPGLFEREVATKDCITHQHVRPAFELLLGIALAAEECPELVGDRRPIQLKFGVVRDPLNPPG